MVRVYGKRIQVGDVVLWVIGMTNCDLGPLVSEEQYSRVQHYLALGKQNGAKLVQGGGRPAAYDKGYFVEPTIFDQVDPGSKIAQEEIFGPVVAIFPFETEEQALQIANGVPYGLSSGVHTQNITRALRMPRNSSANSGNSASANKSWQTSRLIRCQEGIANRAKRFRRR